MQLSGTLCSKPCWSRPRRLTSCGLAILARRRWGRRTSRSSPGRRHELHFHAGLGHRPVLIGQMLFELREQGSRRPGRRWSTTRPRRRRSCRCRSWEPGIRRNKFTNRSLWPSRRG